MDIHLLLGTLELDGQVARAALRAAYQEDFQKTSPSQDADNTTLEAILKGYDRGFEQAVNVMIQAARRVLTEQLADRDKEVSDDLSRNSRRPIGTRPVRIEPEGWSLINSSGHELLQLIKIASQSCSRPAVVFDLDGTLVDVSFRTLGILKEWLTTDGAAEALSSNLANRLAHINLTHVGYSLAHAFENSGLDLRDEQIADAFEAAERYWRKRFFDGRALVDFDRAIPGVASFINALTESGIKILYLTGRNENRMREGTLQQLAKMGLTCKSEQIYMKPDSSIEDHVFKQMQCQSFSNTYDIVGNFENEYINLVSMMDTFPLSCIHVIVDTQHSGRPVPPNPRKVYRLSTFV